MSRTTRTPRERQYRAARRDEQAGRRAGRIAAWRRYKAWRAEASKPADAREYE